MPFSSTEHIELEPDPLETQLKAEYAGKATGQRPKQPGDMHVPIRQGRAKTSNRGNRKAVQSAVGEISALLLKDTIDWRELCALTLKHSLALTGSKLGFASVVDRVGGGTEAHAIVGAPFMPALPERRHDALRSDGARPCLWGIEPDTKRPFYTNSPSKHPLWKGNGDARAAVKNLLSIPVMLGDEQVGLIALADTKSGYRATDIKTLTPVADIYARAIRHKRTGEELARKSHELQLRVNELNCIFLISEVCERRLPIEGICARVVEIIRSAYAFPAYVTVILDIDDQGYMAGSTARPVYIMSSKLVISGLKRGRIKVFYHGPEGRRAQFSPDEQRLLDEVARKFTRSIESMELAAQLRRAHDSLEQKVNERTSELMLSNRYLMAMGNLNRYLLSAGDESGLCEYACDLMVNTCGHDSAWVGIRGEDQVNDRMSVIACSGVELSDVRAMVESPYPDERCLKLPLWLKNGMLNGILAICPSEGSSFGEMEKGFIEDFADELSLGLSSIWTKIEHERAQEKLLNQSRSLEEARKMEVFGRLAGSVAHEVRNPLNAIMGITEALDRRLGGAAEYKPFINHMSEQVERLSKLMKDLLDLGRPVDEARMQVHSVAELCGSAFILWRRGDLGAACEATFEIAEGAKGMNALCDAGKIGQVLINLLDNAVQNGSDEINIHLSVARTPDDRALVKISDQGKGVPEEILARVFEPFFTSRRGGMGLGLSIVKHIVDLHEGTVGIYNNPGGVGCTVEVSLPLVP